MYTSIEKSMSDRTVFKFKEFGSGLYYYDMERTGEHNISKTNAKIPPESLL